MARSLRRQGWSGYLPTRGGPTPPRCPAAVGHAVRSHGGATLHHDATWSACLAMWFLNDKEHSSRREANHERTTRSHSITQACTHYTSRRSCALCVSMALDAAAE